MLCRECGQPTRVLATREHAEGFMLRRTRECPHKHRFFTYEIDDSLEGTMSKHMTSPGRIAGIKKSIALWWRNQKIITRLRQGEKHMTVADDYGLSHNMVSTIARRAGLPNARKVRGSSPVQEA